MNRSDGQAAALAAGRAAGPWRDASSARIGAAQNWRSCGDGLSAATLRRRAPALYSMGAKAATWR